jgi:hypothetical protein
VTLTLLLETPIQPNQLDNALPPRTEIAWTTGSVSGSGLWLDDFEAGEYRRR